MEVHTLIIFGTAFILMLVCLGRIWKTVRTVSIKDRAKELREASKEKVGDQEVPTLEMEEAIRLASQMHTRVITMLFGFAALALICATVIVTVDSRSRALETLHKHTLDEALEKHAQEIGRAARDLMADYALGRRNAIQESPTPPSLPATQGVSVEGRESPAGNTKPD